ncbi:MAG: hypothetical protein JWM92_519 [Candidatus Nomurabacteria bacterium]|nr:hypothetical protein [Candidatus Nomurabacteria bacterium]
MEKEQSGQKRWSRQKFYRVVFTVAVIIVIVSAFLPCSLSKYGCAYGGGGDVLLDGALGAIAASLCLIIVAVIYEINTRRVSKNK